MKTKILITFVILAALCCCSSDSTVETHDFDLTVNANGKMLSETHQKLGDLLGNNSEDSLAVFQTRANLTTNSDFQELDDEQKEAKAKEIFSPYVQDGISIRDEVIRYASEGLLEESPEDIQKFENLDEASLAGVAYFMSILAVVEKEEPLTIDGEPLRLTSTDVKDCLSVSISVGVFGGLFDYGYGTYSLITARTALNIGLSLAGRTIGWVTLASSIYEFAKCLKKRGCVYSTNHPDSLIPSEKMKVNEDITIEP